MCIFLLEMRNRIFRYRFLFTRTYLALKHKLWHYFQSTIFSISIPNPMNLCEILKSFFFLSVSFFPSYSLSIHEMYIYENPHLIMLNAISTTYYIGIVCRTIPKWVIKRWTSVRTCVHPSTSMIKCNKSIYFITAVVIFHATIIAVALIFQKCFIYDYKYNSQFEVLLSLNHSEMKNISNYRLFSTIRKY